MTRGNLVLLVVACVQALLWLLVARPFSADGVAAAPGSHLLVEIPVGEVRELVLDGEDGKETWTFSRPDDQDDWVFTSRDGFPLRPGKLGGGEGIVDLITRIEVTSPIASDPESLEVLGLGDRKFERRLRLLDGAGKTLADLFVARGSRAGTVQVRRADSSEVYETDVLPYRELGMSVNDFVGRDLVKLDPATITGLVIRRGEEEPIRLQRDLVTTTEGETPKPGPWRLEVPAEGELLQDELGDLVDHLADLRITEVHGKSTPEGVDPEHPLVEFEIVSGAGTDRLRLERKRDDGDYDGIWISDRAEPRAGFHVALASWSLGRAATITRADLLEKPEEKMKGEDDQQPEDPPESHEDK
ncbi:MAG: DUF4340 domain-containing protein [Planctomycetes bacterium]|nr:DUF4340 domain-containing protein [Planctomycetota bacterium]